MSESKTTKESMSWSEFKQAVESVGGEDRMARLLQCSIFRVQDYMWERKPVSEADASIIREELSHPLPPID